VDEQMEELKNTESKQPGISFDFSNVRISIHRTTLRVIGFPEFYRFLLNLDKKMLAIQKCGIDDAGAHKLPRITKKDSCEVKSKDFVKLIYHTCGWDFYTTYRIAGIGYADEETVTFDLHDAMIINEK